MAAGESFVYLEIAEAVRRLILSGELAAGDRLPSVRAMADRWGCTPNTASRAYSRLAQEGLISAHRGGGTRVTSRAEGLAEIAPPEWQWANLVNRAETYLLEALNQGHSAAHAEAALTAAIARWQEMRRRPSQRRLSVAAVGSNEIRFSGSHDLSVELLGRLLSGQTPPVSFSVDFVGSLGGLMALARGEADIAGSHLWDQATGEYNLPFVQRVLPNRKVVLLSLVQRMQGLMVSPGNPLRLGEVADLKNPGVVLINRQPGSGTRVSLDIWLRAAGVSAEEVRGYDQEESTHMGVARAVAEGRATVGLGIGAAATAYGLTFVPLGTERYDLVIPLEIWDSGPLRSLRAVVGSQSFLEGVLALGGYDVSGTGVETLLV